MTSRIDGPNLATPTLRNAPTQPLPVEQAPAHAPAQQRQAGDTANLNPGTGEIGVAEDVNLNHVHLPGEEPHQAEGKEEKEEEFKAGEVFGRLHEKTENKTLGKASKVANAPQVILHAVEAGEMLFHDPKKALKSFQNAANDPIGTATAAQETFEKVKSGAETLKQTGEVLAEHTGRVVKNVKAHGLSGGLRETGKELAHDIHEFKTELKENLSHETGAGLRNIPKAVAKETAEAVQGKATKAAMRELEKIHPELAPKGIIGKTMRRVEDLAKPLTERGEKLMATANKVADRVADRAVEVAGRSKAGRGAMKALEKFHPAGGVDRAVMEGAVKKGSEEGAKAATKAVTEAAEKAGVRMTEASTKVASEAIARTAAEETAKVGAKAAGKGLARFAPGVNIAIAGYDAYHAAKVWRDPKSTGWQKGMATATAVFSAAAATNIPIVSQVGAVLSIGTSVLENIKPASIAHAAKAVGGAVMNGLSKLKFW